MRSSNCASHSSARIAPPRKVRINLKQSARSAMPQLAIGTFVASEQN
jgi:hypothetical protein